MSPQPRWSRGAGVRFVASAIGVAADAVLGISLARAGTRVASASVTAATAGSILVIAAEIGHNPRHVAHAPRSARQALRSSATTVGWTGLAWTAATLAEDRNLPKAPVGPALAALQGLTLITGSTWPNRIASGTAQIATGTILSGAAARHEDPLGGAIALTSSGLVAGARLVGISKHPAARTATAILDAGARVAMAAAAARLASLGDERLF